jgi:signal transduction histidine kinase/ActR/RegA family two-component response regulator
MDPMAPRAHGRVVVLLPTAADAERTAVVLAEARVETTFCADLSEVCRELRRGADAILLTDDAIFGDGCGRLAEAVREQPAWSSVPIVVLAREGAVLHVQQAAGEAVRGLTVLERPVHVHTLVSMIQASLRARRHQYQIRDAILLRDQQAAALQAQEERLRRLDRKKDEFLATLAHELRNPLAPIRTGVDILSAGPSAEVTERTLGVIRRQVGHMVRLIDDLLDVSRITRGKLELKRARVRLGDVVSAAIEASRPFIDHGQHRLDVSVEDESLCLDADLTRVAQIVSNLLNNASKYTPPGGLIELSARREGANIGIRVRDNGMGIPPEQLEHVFEMFSQVSRTLDSVQSGLGIGLALVRTLAEMHGGSVTATSPGPGCGSTFRVSLPLAAELEDEPPAPAPKPNEAPPGRRVLVVDDNDDAADLLALMLEQRGYVTSVAYKGTAALDAVRASTPQVVILDIGLPDMSGYDVARALRRSAELGSTPVLIALTGWGTRDDRQRAMDAGFDLHLTKPVDLEMLDAALARVDALVRRRSAVLAVAG